MNTVVLHPKASARWLDKPPPFCAKPPNDGVVALRDVVGVVVQAAQEVVATVGVEEAVPVEAFAVVVVVAGAEDLRRP